MVGRKDCRSLFDVHFENSVTFIYLRVFFSKKYANYNSDTIFAAQKSPLNALETTHPHQSHAAFVC